MKKFLLITLLLPAILFAEVYKYTDQDGKVHYVTDQKKIPAQYQGQAKQPDLPALSKGGDVNWEEKGGVSSGTATATAPRRNHKVEVYVTPNCPYCDELEKLLKRHKVSYKRYDITTDFEAQQKFTEYGGMGTPLIKIDDNILKGYQPEAVKRYLEIK